MCRDNVAAGSDATGFWFAFPEHPTGAFEGTEISRATWPRRTKFREFKATSPIRTLTVSWATAPQGRWPFRRRRVYFPRQSR